MPRAPATWTDVMVINGPISYFKRYRMEVDLERLPPPAWRDGFRCLPWQSGLLEVHAEVLFECFRAEIDAAVFPSLATRDGCAGLMWAIARRKNFAPEATWLLVGPEGPCGTVQGLRERWAVGAIQNVGVLPGWRGRGLGRALILQALQGFRRVGLARGQLEVTARNETALGLYRRLGFRRSRTIYKAAPAGGVADRVFEARAESAP